MNHMLADPLAIAAALAVAYPLADAADFKERTIKVNHVVPKDHPFQIGLEKHRMPSGAGHDAMKLHEVMPQAMLFMRGLDGGISHNPLEAIANDDTEVCVRAFQGCWSNLRKSDCGLDPLVDLALLASTIHT